MFNQTLICQQIFDLRLWPTEMQLEVVMKITCGCVCVRGCAGGMQNYSPLHHPLFFSSSHLGYPLGVQQRQENHCSHHITAPFSKSWGGLKRAGAGPEK